MAVNEIEINTSTLQGDIETLENLLSQIDSQIKIMFQSVGELDQMWDGPANDAFNQQFQLDHDSCRAMYENLQELLGSLKHAKVEYDKCEQNIDSRIRSIAV